MTNAGDPPSALPAGFKPLFRSSPFLDHNGPFFFRENADGTFVRKIQKVVFADHADSYAAECKMK